MLIRVMLVSSLIPFKRISSCMSSENLTIPSIELVDANGEILAEDLSALTLFNMYYI